MAKWVLISSAGVTVTIAIWTAAAARMTSEAIKWNAWLDERLDAIDEAESAA
jgi:hypothetical protein